MGVEPSRVVVVSIPEKAAGVETSVLLLHQCPAKPRLWMHHVIVSPLIHVGLPSSITALLR